VVTARLVITNTTADTARFLSGSSCLAFIGVYRGSKRQEGFPDTDYGCLTVVTPHQVAPMAALTSEWRIRIGAGGGPTPAGDYSLRVEFHPNPAFPRLEGRFAVR
jgi:hypothetical protein